MCVRRLRIACFLQSHYQASRAWQVAYVLTVAQNFPCFQCRLIVGNFGLFRRRKSDSNLALAPMFASHNLIKLLPEHASFYYDKFSLMLNDILWFSQSILLFLHIEIFSIVWKLFWSCDWVLDLRKVRHYVIFVLRKDEL